MAINYELINKGGISLGTNFELLGEKPLDARLVVPSLDGLAHLITEKAAYAGMIVYVTAENKHYQVNADGTYREFGITADELKTLIASETTAAMEFKGATATLPENPGKGDMYKVAGENINIKIDGVDAKLGDSIVYNGEQWFLIPSGDDIEDTWRPVSGVDNDATLTFAAGDKLDKTVTADGTITYKHAAIDSPELLAENEQTRTYITEVETDGFGHITGYKTATENVVDTNTEYEFTSQVESSSVYFQVEDNKEDSDTKTIYLDAYSKNEADDKFVAKETGYSLVSDTEIARLAKVNNYDDEEVRGLVGDNAKAIEDLEKYVGTIPNVPDADGNNKYADLDVIGYVNKKAQETLDAASGNSSETAASVKQQLDDYKGENNTRFKNIEDDVAAIKDAETGLLKQAQDYADSLASNYDEAGAAAGVKSELEVEIAKKVDAVEGKDLIATSEIERLTTLHNYDDTQVKADIAKKADAEEMATELGKKVDKVEGYSLVSDAEIERLGTLHNYDDTALAGRVSTAEGKIADLEAASATHATKDELNGVDAKFANYKTAADQKLIDDEQDRRLGVIEGDYLKAADIANFETKENVKKVADDLAAETKARSEADAALADRIADLEANFGDGEGTVEAQIAAAVKVEEDARKEAVKGVQDEVDAVEGRMDTAEGKISALETESAKHAIKTEVEGALALKADKSVVDAMYTNAQIDGFIAEAKKYADDNDADTKYGIAYDSENKKIKLVEGGTTAEIDATAFIKDGMIESVALSEDGLNLVITWNTDANKGENNVTTIPLTGLVDIYTGVNGDRVNVTVSSDKKVSADLVAGSISKNYLDDGVQASLAKADSALQSHQDISHLATIEELNKKQDIIPENTYDAYGAAASAESNAKAYTEEYAAQKEHFDANDTSASIKYGYYSTTVKDGNIINSGDATTLQIKSEGSEGEASLTILAQGAGITYSCDKYGDSMLKHVAFTEDVSATYAEKATTLAGYGIGDAYTKTEVDAAVEEAKTDASNKDVVILSEAQKYADALAGNVYNKSETYTKEEVNAAIADALAWGEF